MKVKNRVSDQTWVSAAVKQEPDSSLAQPFPLRDIIPVTTTTTSRPLALSQPTTAAAASYSKPFKPIDPSVLLASAGLGPASTSFSGLTIGDRPATTFVAAGVLVGKDFFDDFSAIPSGELPK